MTSALHKNLWAARVNSVTFWYTIPEKPQISLSGVFPLQRADCLTEDRLPMVCVAGQQEEAGE